MECRITSEDSANGFLPSTGRVSYLHLPSGPGVRWDGGIEAGSEVGLHYDPMLAKLIVWAPDRDQAVTRMRRALVDLIIEGIETSRDFHVRLMDDAQFRAGAIDIQWLERRLGSIVERKPSESSLKVAAIGAALLAERERAERSAPDKTSVGPGAPTAADSWKQAARLEGLRS